MTALYFVSRLNPDHNTDGGRDHATLPPYGFRVSYLVITAGAGSGGGAFPFPIDPQALKLATASTATTAIRILLI
jgi:hypothetical protein